MSASSRRSTLPEFQKKRQARLRFRNLVRWVSFNRLGLIDTDDAKMTLNVKKNIAMLIRKTHKIGMLTGADKTILRKSYAQRTVPERKQLLNMIMNLNCFSKIAPVDRARLARVIKFSYLTKGRTLISEGRQPLDVYFVLCGEIEIMAATYDYKTQSYKDTTVALGGPGDTVGDLEILENINRLCTMVATTDVELLCVYAEHVEQYLRPALIDEHNAKKRAIEELEYFDFFTQRQLMSAMKIGELREYKPLETIYIKDVGLLSYVHFVLSGECMILQRLNMKVTMNEDGTKKYELMRKHTRKEESMSGSIGTPEILKKMRVTGTSRAAQSFAFESELATLDDEATKSAEARKPANAAEVQAECAKRMQKESMLMQQRLDEIQKRKDQTAQLFSDKDDFPIKKVSKVEVEEAEEQYDIVAEESIYDFEETDDIEEHRMYSTSVEEHSRYTSDMTQSEMGDEETTDFHTTESGSSYARTTVAANTRSTTEGSTAETAETAETSETNRETTTEASATATETARETGGRDSASVATKNKDTNAPTSASKSKENISASKSEGRIADLFDAGVEEDDWCEECMGEEEEENQERESSFIGIPRERYNRTSGIIESRFIDVGSITYGGIIGLGEEFIDRVVMARNTVQCLLIPRFWLYEQPQNPGNIWQRRRFILDSNIPCRDALFQHFLKDRNWDAFKKEFIESVVGDNATGNLTKPQDIPIMGRIMSERKDD